MHLVREAKTTGLKQLHDFTSHLKASLTFNSLEPQWLMNKHKCNAEYGSHTVSLVKVFDVCSEYTDWAWTASAFQ